MHDVSAIDRTIEGMETLYRSLTGGEPPSNGGAQPAAFPPEVDPNHYLNAQLDRLIAMLDPSWMKPPRRRFAPAVGLWETAERYVVSVDLPGVPRESVAVAPVGHALRVSAVRRPPEGSQSLREWPRFHEAPLGELERIIPLPPDAAVQAAEATLENGCLTITIPRPQGGAIAVR